MKLTITILLFLCLEGIYSQSAYQKILPEDSLGCTGLVFDNNQNVLVCVQDGIHWKLLSLDIHGNLHHTWRGGDTSSQYMQQMVDLQQGGVLLIGNRLGERFMIKVNNQYQVDWAAHKTEGPGFSTGYFYQGCEAVNEDIALLGARDNYCSMLCVNPQGQWQWSLHPTGITILSCLKPCTAGGYYVSGYSFDSTAVFLWKIAPDGTTQRCLRMKGDYPYMYIKDIQEGPGEQLTFLVEFRVINHEDYAIGWLNQTWDEVTAKSYYSFLGFREISSLFRGDSGQLVVIANVTTSNSSLTVPEYQVCRIDHGQDGQVISANSFQGGKIISGVSQAVSLPDKGVVIGGYAADSMSYPYFPFLLKTDSLGFTPCFNDPVTILTGSFALSCKLVDNPLLHSFDSLVPDAVTLEEIPLPQVTTLCYTGLEEDYELTKMRIYPNPASTELYVTGADLAGIGEIRILNYLGQQVYSSRVRDHAGLITLPIGDLSPACYYLEARNGMISSYRRFIKISR